MPAFLGGNNFCQDCKQSYDRTHRCLLATCDLCLSPKCQNKDPQSPNHPPQQCKVCNEIHKTQLCFDAHKLDRCAKFKRCLLCWEQCRSSEFKRHICGKPLCQQCQQRHSPLENCFVTADKPKKDRKKETKVLYGDIETFVDAKGQHTANLIIFKDQEANNFGLPYKGPDAVKKLVDDLIKEGSPFKDSKIFFHNGGRFDVHLIFGELIERRMTPKYINKGTTLLTMDLAQNNISFRDTLQFMPGTPLAAFPKNFGLESGPKGYFPHGVNGPQWVDFSQPGKPYLEDGKRFPLLKYFNPDNKKAKELQELKNWHKSEVAKYRQDPEKRYYPALELVKYCDQDVRILAQGFQKYRMEWLDQFPDMDPADYLTFPQFNNALFRNHYMPKDSLAILPRQGFEVENNMNSKECFAWLNCFKADLKAQGLKVVKERNGRQGFEIRICGAKVDGAIWDSAGRLHILQFQGCYWHGCPHCGQDTTDAKKIKYQETLETSRRLKELSSDPRSPYGLFQFHDMCGCEFKDWKKKSLPHAARIRMFMDAWKKEPLRPRDAFFGGRTNTIKHRVVAKPKEGIHYVDFTRLYPVSLHISGFKSQIPGNHVLCKVKM